MRTIVVSSHPALALFLATQLPDLDTYPAESFEAVIDLTTDDAVVLLDAGGAKDAETWLRKLRDAGLDGGIVVLDEVDPAVLDAATVALPRPFSFDQLEVALRAVATGPSEPDAAEEDRAVVSSPKEPVDALPLLTEPTEPLSEVAQDRLPLSGEARRGPATAEDQANSTDNDLAPPRDRPRWLHWLTSKGELELEPSLGPAPAGPAAQVAVGLHALADLEYLLEQMPVVAYPGTCGRVLLEEFEPLHGCDAAVALRVDGDQLEVVAASGAERGLGSGHLDVDHPYVRALVERGGVMRIEMTDGTRGLLAGVPYSHRPSLLGILISDGARPDGLVLVGCPLQTDDDEVARLVALVEEAAPVLRLAAGLQRLRPVADPHYRRSWER
jgi:hypothetical protein